MYTALLNAKNSYKTFRRQTKAEDNNEANNCINMIDITLLGAQIIKYTSYGTYKDFDKGKVLMFIIKALALL